MKVGDRFKRTHSLGSVMPHYQRGYESTIAEMFALRGIPSIRDTNGHEHYVAYIEIIRDPLAEIDDLKAQIASLVAIIRQPAEGNLYHDTETDTRVRLVEIKPRGDTYVITHGIYREERLGSNFRSDIESGRYVRIPG